MNLTQRGFGGSLSGDSFSYLHGDLIAEIINGKRKRQTGVYCVRFRTYFVKVNTWVASYHIPEEVRQTLLDKIQLNTSTSHKE